MAATTRETLELHLMFGLKELLEAVGNVSMNVNMKIDDAARSVAKGTEATLKKLEGSTINGLSKNTEPISQMAELSESNSTRAMSTIAEGLAQDSEFISQKVDNTAKNVTKGTEAMSQKSEDSQSILAGAISAFTKGLAGNAQSASQKVDDSRTALVTILSNNFAKLGGDAGETLRNAAKGINSRLVSGLVT